MAAGAFAIDLGNGLTVVGEVKTGVAVTSLDDGEEDTKYDAWAGGYNNDAGEVFRSRVTFEYSGDWGGAKIRLQGLGFPGDAQTSFSTKYAYGWANFLDKKIVLSGGKIDGHSWDLGKLSANVFDPGLDAVNGVRAEFKLVDGLSFGVALDVPTTRLPPETAPKPNPNTIDHMAGRWVIGALYKSSLISAALGAAFKPGTDEPAAGGYADDSYVDAIFGVEVNPIAGLTALVDFRLDTRKYETHGKIGFIRIGPKVVYATGPITAHLQGDITIQNEAPGKDKLINGRDGKKTHPAAATDYELNGSVPVEYPGDPIIAARIGADYKVSETIGAYLQIGSDNVAWLAGDKDKNQPGAGLYVKPGIKFTLGPSSIEIFDKINRLGAAELKADATKGIEDHSPVVNQFQIDFNWKF